MNYRWATAILILLISSSRAFAQLPLPQDSLHYPAPQHMIVANPGALAVDYLGISYYVGLSTHNGIGAQLLYLYRPVGDESAHGVGAGIAYRYYPGNQALWRFHYGPTLTYQYAFLVGKDSINANGVGLGLSVGWQWFPERGFAVGFEIGEQYVFRFNDQENGALNKLFGARPIMAFDLGYAW